MFALLTLSRSMVPLRSSTLLPAARSSRLISTVIGMSGYASGAVVPIGQAKAGRVDLGDGVSLWYREWGNPAGTPVVFVHGGPGQCVADYNDVNARFFDEALFRVVEVDQRGTGQSPPKLTRTPRPSQPPALGTHQRRRAAWPQRATYCTYWVHVPASGVPYAPRTGMHLRTAAPLTLTRSQPSVRDDYRHMATYADISIEQMSADLEL